MMGRREVRAGQRYRKAETTLVWEVQDLARDAEGITHARLIRVGDPTSVKLISVSALKDPRLYRIVQQAAGEP